LGSPLRGWCSPEPAWWPESEQSGIESRATVRLDYWTGSADDRLVEPTPVEESRVRLIDCISTSKSTQMLHRYEIKVS
jgi:hypothetical protein